MSTMGKAGRTAPQPFFTAAGAPGERRLLLVSAAFPPSAEVGALRWLRIAQFARARGWTVDVVLIDPVDPGQREEHTLREVPAGAALYDVPLRETWIQRVERAARAWLTRRRRAGSAVPATALEGALVRTRTPVNGQGRSAGGGSLAALLRVYRTLVHFAQWNDWVRRATRAGIALTRQRPYRVVVSSGPPHFAHEVARQVSAATGLPLVIDLRDPWFSDDVEPPELRGRIWRRRTRAMEGDAVARASLVVLNTESCRRLMTARYPAHASRMLTVMNGADADVGAAAAHPDTFIISHTGSLYSGRDPRILFRAVARVVQRLHLSPSDLRVHFMGDDVYEGRPLRDLATADGVERFTRIEARRPRAEALALSRSSAMVVLLPQHHVHSIPGKLFEYVQLPAWLLVLTDPGTATEVVLRGSGADVLPPGDEAAVADAIESRYLAFRRGERPLPINADGRFDRERQAAKLLDALDSIA